MARTHADALDMESLRRMAEQFHAGGLYNWDSQLTPQELNARIPAKKPKVQQVLVHGVETADHKRANIMVLVPNAFGTQEPLLDGATGQPVNFFDDFGDARSWTRNMGPEIKEAAVRAGKVCAALVRSRGNLA